MSNMAKSNVVYPQLFDVPVTSQPSSRENLHVNGDLNNHLKDDGVLLPTPRRFLTPEDCPPGLECLVEPEYVFMKQSLHTFEGWDTFLTTTKMKKGHPEDCAKYEVLTMFGQRIFMVAEKIEAAQDNIFCAGATPFALRVYSKTSETHFRKEVLQIGGHPGSFGCGAEILIKYDGKKLGTIEQDSDCSTMRYTIQNAEGKDVLKILGPSTGPCCSLGNLLIHEFDIYLSDGQTHVGRIAKHWSGVPSNKEVFTRSDIWGVKFPQEYDVRLKVLLLASVFLMIINESLRMKALNSFLFFSLTLTSFIVAVDIT